MTVLSVPGGKGRGGPIEGEGPERATISTQNNVGPMTAQETMFFNRVKDWLGTGVNERVLMQVVKSNSMISTTNTSEGAMNDLVVAYLDRLQTENKAGKQVRFDEAVDKCTSGGEYSSGNTIDHRIQTHVTETIQVKSKGTTNRIKAYSSTCLENREEQDVIKAIEESLKENQNIPGFSPIAQSDPENPHERRRYELAPVGLKNMGNSCWFNVVSQTLYHIPKFRSKIFEVKTDFLSTRGSNPSANEPSSSTQPSITPQTLLITFRRLYALLLASERGYVDPSDVLSTISELNATLNKAVPSMGIQQDATEMLLRIIEWLEQALRIYETFCADMRSPTLPMEVEGQDEAMPLDENCDPTDPTTDKQRDCLNNNLVASPTENISNNNNNNNNNNNDNGQTLPFSSLFHGSHIEIRLSADGSITSSKLDNSLQMVNLDVSFDNLHDSLEAYHFADAPSKEVWFDSIPNVIIFSMVRFSYKNGQTEKLHNKFHFPMDFYMDRYMHRNRAVVLQRKKYRAALKQKLNSIRAQLNRMRNYPVGKVNASIPEILNALLSLKSTYFDNWNESEIKMDTTTESEGSRFDENLSCVSITASQNSAEQLERMDAESLASSSCEVKGNETCQLNNNNNNEQQPASNEMNVKLSVPSELNLNVLESFLRYSEVQFQHFINDLIEQEKELETAIETTFDTDGLKEESYRLHAVIIHEGEANVGHYWAYIADHTTLNVNGCAIGWRKFNDKTVESATWSQIEEDAFGSRRTCSAYCLVYTRKKFEEELFKSDTNENKSTKTLDELLAMLPNDLRSDVESDNETFRLEMSEWDAKHSVDSKSTMTPTTTTVMAKGHAGEMVEQQQQRICLDQNLMSLFSSKCKPNVDQLNKKFYAQAYRHFGALIIDKAIEKVLNGKRPDAAFFSDTATMSSVVDEATRSYQAVIEHQSSTKVNEKDRKDARLFLTEWLKICSIPISQIARMVYLLRVLVCSDKIAVRKAFEGKLHAIAGTMKPSAFEAIDNELTDAHILFEVFWQSVAVLHEVSRKLLSSEGVLAVTVTVQSDEWTVPKNQCTADLKQLQRQCKLLCVAIRMLDRLVPYMTDDSQSTRDNGLLTLFVDFLLIYHAIRITSELAVSVLKTASVQKFEECALFLSNEYKAMIMRIRSMNCEASDKALSAILTVWANISAKSKDLFKVASFHQMLKEASEVEMSTVEMPAINANVNIQDPWPDLYELCSIMQKTMLLNRCDLSRIIQLLIEHLLNPLLSLSNNNEQTTSSLL